MGQVENVFGYGNSTKKLRQVVSEVVSVEGPYVVSSRPERGTKWSCFVLEFVGWKFDFNV